MNELKLVSVIVTVFNVENYIENCINSIAGQSYKNLQIVIVDDGSTDSSGKVCDRLSMKDDRIEVIHQVNEGVASARNKGLEACKGEYICFVDGDDYIHPDYVKYLYKLCVENACEISICGHCVTDVLDYRGEVDLDACPRIYSRSELFDIFYSDLHGAIVVPWNKLYSRKCIADIRYDSGLIHEDEATTFKFLYNASNIAYSNQVLYYYYSRDNSITGIPYSKKRLDILRAYENRLSFYSEKGEIKLYNRECMMYLSELLMNYYKVYVLLNRDVDLLREIRSKYLGCYRTADKSEWGLGRRLLYALCVPFPLAYGRLKHILST